MKRLERRPPHCLTGCPNFAAGKCLCRSIIPGKSCPFAFPFVSMAVSQLAFPTLMVPSLFMVRHSVKSLTAYRAMSKSTFLQWVVKIEAHVNFPERYSFFFFFPEAWFPGCSVKVMDSHLIEMNCWDESLGSRMGLLCLGTRGSSNGKFQFLSLSVTLSFHQPT